MELVVVIVILGFTGIGEILILDIIYEIDFFLNMSLCFWFCICHFYCLFSVLSFTEIFIDHSIKDFVLFRRSKARQKRSNHKYFGASKTNRDGVADYSPVGESAIFVESLTQHRASPKMNKTPSDNNLIIESNETIYNAAYNTRSGRSNTDEEIYDVIQ